MFKILSLIPTLLSKSKTESLIKNLRESFKLKHREGKYNKNFKGKSDEESKGNLDEETKGKSEEKYKESFDEDDLEDILDENFDIYALDYLCGEKIDQLHAYTVKPFVQAPPLCLSPPWNGRNLGRRTFSIKNFESINFS